MGTEFYVNIDAVMEASERIGSISLGSLEYRAQEIVKGIIMEEIISATRIADSNDGFPDEFKSHVINVASEIIPTVIIDGWSIFVSVDLEEWLGDRDDLERAYHQGAQLADGGILDGPYTGQTLKNEDEAERHVFWEAIRYGHERVEMFDRKTGKNNKITIKDAAGKWEETKRKYIEIWGGKAPEWLFIQFGQDEWEPTVTQVDIYGNIQDQVNNLLSGLLLQYVDTEVRIANLYESTGVSVGFTKRGSVRLKEGTFYNPATGKTIRPGQFAPKNF